MKPLTCINQIHLYYLDFDNMSLVTLADFGLLILNI